MREPFLNRLCLLLRLDLEFLESTPKTLINSLHATARNFDTPSYWTLTNNKRLQRNLGILTPMEKHENYLQAT
ncbi:MAG: hypothetical protein EGQ54_00190 [[Ruminococcus] lactaris]|nr:hypothetical protein [[Ruminococcus] lactaris]